MASILNSLSKISKKDIVMSVRDIKKTFIEGGQPLNVLRGGGFDLYRGEIVALVGQSGSGKSTLLYTVSGMDSVTSGQVIFDKAVKTVRELDSTGLPLGIKRNLTLKNNEFILNNNETLVLYTDGSFEFTDNNNEKFKFDKLKEMLVDSYNDHAEVFYHNLYDSISKRRIGELEDDTTIVIVNWGQK